MCIVDEGFLGKVESMSSFLTHIENNILTITINRPEKKNGMTIDMFFEMAELFNKANLDDSIRCIIVTGAGDYYCAGLDLSGGGGTINYPSFTSDLYNADTLDIEKVNKLSPGTNLCKAIFGCYKPIIAVVNGNAAGSGASMLLPMDYRLVADTANFVFPFTKRGVTSEVAATWFLPRMVGTTKAMDWLISGRVIKAQEALESGMATSVHKQDELMPAAHAIAKEIIDKTSAVSVAVTRQLVWQGLAGPKLDELLAAEMASIFFLGSGPEAKEGIESFLEKRLPQFPGKVSADMPPFFPWWQ